MSLYVGNGDKGRFVAEVTDAHEAIRQYVKQEAADEFVGHRE